MQTYHKTLTGTSWNGLCFMPRTRDGEYFPVPQTLGVWGVTPSRKVTLGLIKQNPEARLSASKCTLPDDAGQTGFFF